ncbi:hypothetical protein [Amycolatopsis sp. NPDC004378]
MKILTRARSGPSKRTLAGAALAGAFAISALALDVSAAEASPDNRELASPAAATAAAHPAGQPCDYCVPSKTIWVGTNGAQLRSAPTTGRRNVIDSANAGNGFTTDCWTQENFSNGGYIWFHGTLWGGRTGYMRIDMFRAGADDNPVITRC